MSRSDEVKVFVDGLPYPYQHLSAEQEQLMKDLLYYVRRYKGTAPGGWSVVGLVNYLCSLEGPGRLP